MRSFSFSSIPSPSVEALVEAKLKEHVATLETNQAPLQDEDYTLSAKQVEYALSLIEKVKDEFELAIAPSKLTIKDLNRLIAYNRYKNKGTLINLVKKGILKKK
ncbi:ABC transporter ATP-binding protein [Neobacillus niacini]|nr:ABC transporter ATP-binding protein [Neobacillus niacini]